MEVSAFETTLSGGHPNSLGKTVEVTALVLANEGLLDDLIGTYASQDEVVRLRVSSAIKRIGKVQPEWIHSRLSIIEGWVLKIEQPSAQWTLAQLYLALSDQLTAHQRQNATVVLRTFLTKSSDWIVLNFSMETLAVWAIDDSELQAWLAPLLRKLQSDPRKSVATRATKLLKRLAAQP